MDIPLIIRHYVLYVINQMIYNLFFVFFVNLVKILQLIFLKVYIVKYTNTPKLKQKMETVTKLTIAIVILLLLVVYLYSTRKAEYADLLSTQQALVNEQANLAQTQSNLTTLTAQLADLRQQIASEASKNTNVSTQVATCQTNLASCTSQLATLQQQADLWMAIRAYMSAYNVATSTSSAMQNAVNQAKATNAGNIGVLQAALSNYLAQQSVILQPMWNVVIAKALALNLGESDLVNQGYLPVMHR